MVERSSLHDGGIYNASDNTIAKLRGSGTWIVVMRGVALFICPSFDPLLFYLKLLSKGVSQRRRAAIGPSTLVTYDLSGGYSLRYQRCLSFHNVELSICIVIHLFDASCEAISSLCEGIY